MKQEFEYFYVRFTNIGTIYFV